MRFQNIDFKNKRVAFHTLGCKVNIYESEAMMEEVKEQGGILVPFDSEADIYIVNTCTVTNIADRKSRQILRRAKSKNPNAVLIGAGCFVKLQDEKTLREIGVDEIIRVNDENKMDVCLQKTTVHTRADVKVQDGCDRFCSYCIIPYARGILKSKPIPIALEEMKTLAENGIQEVVITGIHLSSYGKDLKDGTDLISLLEEVEKIPELKRIRIGSLEPMIVTDEFSKRLSKLSKICPHFHLSLQSGSDEILKKMNRHYTTAQYEESCGFLRKYFENPAITTDVITGFPGETEEDFERTREFCRKIGFYELHVFPYSRRRGTRADRMENQLTDKVKRLRARILISDGEKMAEEFRNSMIGHEVEVLTEEFQEINGEMYQKGYTREYILVLVKTLEKNKIFKGKLLKTGDLYSII